MKIIIDTHILLWWVSADRRLPAKARRLIENTRNNILVSAASVWEIAIKQTLGRIKINLNELEDAITQSNFEPLPVKLHHAIEIAELQSYHNDPFDQMLVAQCLSETAYLLTHDEKLQKYGQAIIVV